MKGKAARIGKPKPGKGRSMSRKTKLHRVERAGTKIVVNPDGTGNVVEHLGGGSVNRFHVSTDNPPEVRTVARSKAADGQSDVGERFIAFKPSVYLTLHINMLPDGLSRGEIVKNIEKTAEREGVNLSSVHAGFFDGDVDKNGDMKPKYCQRKKRESESPHEHLHYTCGRMFKDESGKMARCVPIWVSFPMKDYATAERLLVRSKHWKWVDHQSPVTGIIKGRLPSTGTTAHLQSRIVPHSNVAYGNGESDRQSSSHHEDTGSDFSVQDGGNYRKPRPSTPAQKERRKATGNAIKQELHRRTYRNQISSGNVPEQTASRGQRTNILRSLSTVKGVQIQSGTSSSAKDALNDWRFKNIDRTGK